MRQQAEEVGRAHAAGQPGHGRLLRAAGRAPEAEHLEHVHRPDRRRQLAPALGHEVTAAEQAVFFGVEGDEAERERRRGARERAGALEHRREAARVVVGPGRAGDRVVVGGDQRQRAAPGAAGQGDDVAEGPLQAHGIA